MVKIFVNGSKVFVDGKKTNFKLKDKTSRPPLVTEKHWTEEGHKHRNEEVISRTKIQKDGTVIVDGQYQVKIKWNWVFKLLGISKNEWALRKSATNVVDFCVIGNKCS